MIYRSSYLVPALLPGLIMAQAIATIQVYLSNSGLHCTLETIKAHGYLPVPTDLVMPNLNGFLPAFCGGLFFTLSLGAGLSLLALAAAWAWGHFPRRKRTLLMIYSLCGLGILIAVNFLGLNLAASAYFVCIPPLVFRAALGGPAPAGRRAGGYISWITVGSGLLLAILWFPHLDSDIFGKVRDRLLLSNRIGQQFNQFYYDYTLYAAEVLKSLDQKTLKTCSVADVKRAPVARALAKEFAKHDYLNRGSDGVADLQVTEADSQFVLTHRGKVVMATTLKDLLSRTGPVLKEFSDRTDRQVFFRKTVYYSLLIGLPVILYLFLVDLFRFGLGFFLTAGRASLAAGLICFCLGAGLLAVFSPGSDTGGDGLAAAGALESENFHDRVAALKMIEQKGLEVAGFAGYDRLLGSPHVAERYWLVRTLGVSRQARTYRDLLNFLDDPQLNVATMAYYALGRRGDRRAVAEILARIQASRHWYKQWYAYRALKALGWAQSRNAEMGQKGVFFKGLDAGKGMRGEG